MQIMGLVLYVSLVVLRFQGRIDPDRGWFGGRFRCLSDQPLGVQAESAVECALDDLGLAVMDLIGGHQPRPAGWWSWLYQEKKRRQTFGRRVPNAWRPGCSRNVWGNPAGLRGC